MIIMKKDTDIEKELINRLKEEPVLNGEEIKVSVKNGVATLSGFVNSYLKKDTINYILQQLPGVKVFAQGIQVLSYPLE